MITDDQLLDAISSARTRLYDKLARLDLAASGLSEYNQRYLKDKFVNMKGVLRLYGRLIHLSLRNSPVPLEDRVLVDYGGGCGLISLLALETGVGNVVYNDIYDVSCVDVGLLSGHLGLSLNHVVCGDATELVSYLRENALSPDAITSYDVLEHIYDVESHFRTLGTLTDARFRVVYATSANIANPLYVHLVRKRQIQAEHETRKKKWGHKESDTLQAYHDLRKGMISSYAPDLAAGQVEALVRSTRGLIRRDIERCVDEFRAQGRISYSPDHPTNTCDPCTGNWCEHLIRFDWLKEILGTAGFSVELLAGHYNISGSPLKRSVLLFMNLLNRLFGGRSMFAAAYYVMYAEYPAE